MSLVSTVLGDVALNGLGCSYAHVTIHACYAIQSTPGFQPTVFSAQLRSTGVTKEVVGRGFVTGPASTYAFVQVSV